MTWTRFPRPSLARPAVRLVTVHTGLVVAGVLAVLLLPGGPVRAVLVAPALLWVPGRSVLGALRLTGPSGAAGAAGWALSVGLSIVVVLVVALGANLLLGRVPFEGVPLVAAVATLPLGLCDRDGGVVAARAVGFGLVVAFGLAAFGGLVWMAAGRMAGPPRAPYLQFALAGPDARLPGVLTAEPGQLLRVPVTASSSDPGALRGLTVGARIDGWDDPASPPVPLSGGGAQVTVRVPAGCRHQLRITLTRGAEPLRTLTVYTTTSDGQPCGPS